MEIRRRIVRTVTVLFELRGAITEVCTEDVLQGEIPAGDAALLEEA